MISRKAISRRTLLKGSGAMVALPLLDAMIPAATAMAETVARGRKAKTNWLRLHSDGIQSGPMDSQLTKRSTSCRLVCSR